MARKPAIPTKIFALIAAAVLTFGCGGRGPSPIGVVNLRCEYLTEPLGIDAREPELSWELAADGRGLFQTAYQILVASDPSRLAAGQADAWDSGKVKSGRTHHVRYAGTPLASGSFYHWKVRIWDQSGRRSEWSPTARWSAGLLEKADWKARWIGAPPQDVPREQRYSISYGYRSAIASSAEEAKWAVVDLGASRDITEVRLYPIPPLKAAGWGAMAPDAKAAAKAYLFPVRFRIDVSSEEGFGSFKTVADETRKDFAPSAGQAYVRRFPAEKVRYVRIAVTRLPQAEPGKYAFALAEMEVYGSEGLNLALDKAVTTSGEQTPLQIFTAENWSPAVLTDGLRKDNADSSPELPVPPSPLLRREFGLAKAPQRALLTITALGLYEARINGRKVGDHVLAPESTDYHARVQYQTYDVTDLVREGSNALGVILADGWYAGPVFSHPKRGSYGFDRRLLAQLEISYPAGGRETLVSDGSWKVTDRGPIRRASIWDGEAYDARLEQAGWDQPGFDDSGWAAATVDPSISIALSAQMNEPIRMIEERKPVAVSQKGGLAIVDVGRNVVGWAGLSLPYNPGAEIRLRYAEVLDEKGALYTLNLRGAEQTDTYVPGREKAIRYEPRFTYHGFRYIEISGLTRPLTLDDVTVKVVASAAPPAGRFAASHEGLNALWENILWTQRGNMHSIPTDCPQRDERAGWMGDAQVFSQTAIFNLDMAAFFRKWIRDIRDSQTPEGRFPDFAPQVGASMNFYNAPGWADAGVIVPWNLYLNYGDVSVLAEQYEAMKKFIDLVHQQNPDLLWRRAIGNMYGDWLNGDTIKSADYPKTGGKVPDDVYATSFFAYSTGLLAKTAGLLGRREDAARYAALAKDIRRAYRKEFVSEDGVIRGGTPAGYARALAGGPLPEAMRAKAAARMAEAVEAYDGRISTGIQSTIRLMNQLSEYGYDEIAYRLLESRRFPSWLYSVDQGATTIWERWDGFVAGRGFQNPGMNSFNHYAIGAVGEWMVRTILGINPQEAHPGYARFSIRPMPGGSLTWAKGSYHSIAGPIAVAWAKEGGLFRFEVEIPVNTTADVLLPTSDAGRISESGKPVRESAGVEVAGSSAGRTTLRVGSGKYVFEVR